MINKIAEDFTPSPINLLESNRSLGYSIEEAVSDLIDNSVAANAKNISFYLEWNDGKPYFVLIDDGNGMSMKQNELIESFKLGSSNPLEKRDPSDLGRFGFGMKTASLSQSKAFIVLTKKNNDELFSRCLDLDFITNLNDGWKLRHVNENENFGFDNKILKQNKGTAIIWNSWDKAPKDQTDFNTLSNLIFDYVSVCFHRFLENGIKIFCNDNLIYPCSPIPKTEGGAEEFSKSTLADNKSVKLGAYVIQHPMKWGEDYESSLSFNSFKLFNGFERQQGVYIYRCDRLLTPNGGWLGVLKNGNSAKLARVTIDYPNDADSLWSLDITKTNAKIPYEFVKGIKFFVEKTRKKSNVKINRGNRVVRKSITELDGRIWREVRNSNDSSLKYELNSSHDIFKFFSNKNKLKGKEMNSILEIISDCLPVAKIIENNDLDPSRHDRAMKAPKLDERQLEIAKIIFLDEISENSKSQAFSYLISREPWCYHEKQLKNFLNA